MRYVLGLALTMGMAAPAGDDAVWVFFSPDSPDASKILEALRGERVRTVMLVERYFGDRAPAAPFLSTLQAAGEIRVVDEEGLAKARELKISRLPAVAVVRGGRAHVATGAGADVKELLRCSK